MRLQRLLGYHIHLDDLAGEIGSRRIAIKKPGPSLLLVSVLTGSAKLALAPFIEEIAQGFEWRPNFLSIFTQKMSRKINVLKYAKKLTLPYVV